MKPCYLTLAFLLLFSPEVGAQDVVTVRFGAAEPLPQELHSFNSNLLMATALYGVSYGGPEFGKAISDLSPGGLRFPGGTTANNYLWREDTYSLQEDDKTEWAAKQLELFRKIGRKYDLPGYARVCKEFGLTPIYVLNVYEETPESVIEMFNRFDELGLDVKAIEMGNEPYWDPRSLMNVWDYIKYCQPLAEAIRGARPEVKIGACFGPLRDGSTYAEKWNAPLAKQEWYDAIVYHEYYGGQGFALEKGEQLTMEAVLHPEAFVDEPVESFGKLLPGKPIWFTEWNIGSKGLDQWKNTGAELLFIAATVSRIIDHREAFDWSCFHQIYEGKFGTFVYDKATGIQTFPSYELFRMIGAVSSGANSLRPLKLDPAGDVRGFATEGDGGLRLLLLNRGDTERAVVLTNSVTGSVAALTIATTPDASLPVSEGIARRMDVNNGSVNLPPYSVTLIAPQAVVQSAQRVEIKKSANLFPARPHLSLWYAPYARNPPRVAPDGSYTVDIDKLADKETVVITMSLSGLTPKKGAQLSLTFEGAASAGIGFNVQLPDGSTENSWTQMTPKMSKYVFNFTYEPEVNKGDVSFVLTKQTLAKGGDLQLQNFRIVELSVLDSSDDN